MIGDKTAPDLPMLRDDEPATLPQLDGLRALLRLTEPVTYPPRLPAAVSPVSRRGSHRAQVPAQTHWRRLGTYGLIGAVVFLAGVGLQVGLVRLAGMSHLASYAIQTAVSIQLSYLLNRLITWRDRDVAPSSWLRFGFQQAIVQGLGVAGYAGLTRIGVEYVAANIAVTAVLAPAGYASSHLWSMTDRREWWRVFTRGPWPLMGVLTVQAALSLRLIWSNTASQDEALYLWSGRMEWSSLLHGTPVPPFATFFSGAPVIYPPLGAVAVAIGGLAGARILSLCFMLGAAVLLWDFTSRLSGRRAAFFATGLWAVLGPTQYLGAYATYDAMSLFLVVLAAWLASHAGIGRDATGWVMGAAGALVAANAAKYASAIFDPVVIAVAALVAMPQSARKEAIRRSAAIAGYVTAALIMLLTIGGGYYVTGVDQTTLTRAGVGNSVLAVLESSWSLVGVVIVASAAGAVICLRRERDRSRRILILVLAGAGLLVPAEQARIHTLTSLNKHVDFGAWFAAVAAGYAIDCGMRVLRPRIVRGAACVACGAALIVPALAGAAQAKVIYAWPDSAAFIAAFRPLVASTSGPILDETPYIAESSLAAGATWERWSNTRSIRLPSGKTISVPVNASGDPGVYQDFIRSHYFTLIALNFTATPGLDQVIKSVVSQDRDYRLVAVVPYGTGHYVIWRYDPQPAVRAVRRSRK